MENSNKNTQNVDSAAFDSFLTKVDSHFTKTTMTTKAGKPKAAYEMKARFDDGGKFTYRSDDTVKRLIKESRMKLDPDKDELRALQIRFATIRFASKSVIIYDNTERYDNNIIFKFEVSKKHPSGHVLVNKIEKWD